ncbi:unnamed protein product [Chondrus crispus]|uniref:Uncharacterized protein n=1 Tax=Chondrus crispus TaxID=2769 RepID=R7QI80_CHOCR|nr:unnamed protein product [Chondrus crispus]CDF37120.1 unnamed protein product [Chondrus crispus]|eukprot:XP_005716939.1 unnamed protein product [Chondrus crispus]
MLGAIRSFFQWQLPICRCLKAVFRAPFSCTFPNYFWALRFRAAANGCPCESCFATLASLRRPALAQHCFFVVPHLPFFILHEVIREVLLEGSQRRPDL